MTDAIELEIFRHLFASVAEEMGYRLMRSAYSPNIKERRDFSCAVFDAAGRMVAQAAHIPVHLGSAPLSVQAILRAFDPAAMSPGDRFVLNDPFEGGTHLPDITLLAPVFAGDGGDDERPAFFVANRAHHADVGGRSAGSMPLSRHIDEEGVRIGPTRLEPGTLDAIAERTRTPDERRGDLQAQLAALRVGVERLAEMCDRYGRPTVADRGRELQDYTARIMRSILADLPDGAYEFTDTLDDDGFDAESIAIRCRLTIDGDRATADFRGSDDQVAGPVNAVRAITVSAVNYVMRCLGPADLPSNSGVLEPVEILTRPGSVVDAEHPAAVAAGNVETSQRIVDVLLGCLAGAKPEAVPAASCGSMNNLTVGGTDPRRNVPFTYYETIAGGSGAGPNRDGAAAIHTHMTNTRNTPVEALEHAYPMRVERHHIRDGSGGEGRRRGGVGVVRQYSFAAAVELTLLTERRRRGPYGLAGGADGQPGINAVIEPDGTQRPLAGKQTLTLNPGQQLRIATPGGGGHGRVE
jgi:N-methylhydantoinase B